MSSRHYQDEHDSGDAGPSYDRVRRNYPVQPHRYQDSPSRDIISPPPGYRSPEPPESPIPSSPTHAFLDHSHDQSRPREYTSEARYTDETPPRPPPHGGVPTSSNRNSIARRPVADPFQTSSDSQGSTYQGRGREDMYAQENPANAYSQIQPPMAPQDRSRGPSPYRQAQRPLSQFHERGSYTSMPLAMGSVTPGSITPARTPDNRSSHMSERSIPLTEYSSRSQRPIPAHYANMPYYNSSHDFDPTISNASINPHNIVDDGDDGFIPDPQRRSMLAIGRSKSKSGKSALVGTTAAGSAAGAAGMAGAGMLGAYQHESHAAMNSSTNALNASGENEKSAWLAKQAGGNRRFRLWAGIGIGLVIILAIVGAIVGAVLGTRSARSGNGGSSGNINNANDDFAHNGDLSISSPEIKALMNNKNLHKVFPGIDYTPWGVQYPMCLTYPPSQNNVTRDIAVLSQLTNTIRLYGTDCNQTEMVLHAMDRLNLKDMKLWLGVWIDTNSTTTERQVNHMYHLLEEIKDHSILKGVIIGNEALFRAGETKAEAQQELITLLSNTRQNFTSLSYDLPIGTSDLGDNWDSTITQASDFVMSNIHPFFAGVSAEVAASWTWSFWQNHDAPLTANTNKQQIISETGWPSGGGTDCGGADGTCTPGQPGAVASVDNMNTFMNDWVCQALDNGTDYFWFEAFDEPWKVQYNTPGREWEDKWGLMDSGRKLKPGVKIPDCGGKTV